MTAIYRFKLADMVHDCELPGVVGNTIQYRIKAPIDWTVVSVELEQNDLLVVLRKLDLTVDNFLNDKYQWSSIEPNMERDMVDLASGFCGPSGHHKAYMRLKFTGKIPGFVVLVQNKFAWISLYDIKQLELVCKDKER